IEYYERQNEIILLRQPRPNTRCPATRTWGSQGGHRHGYGGSPKRRQASRLATVARAKGYVTGSQGQGGMEVDGAVKTGGPQVRGRSGWPGGGGKLFCRQAGRRPVISLVLPRVPLELKAALVVAAVALYAYGLAAHPTAVGTVGSVLDPATADVLRREGGASADGDVHCGIGVV